MAVDENALFRNAISRISQSINLIIFILLFDGTLIVDRARELLRQISKQPSIDDRTLYAFICYSYHRHASDPIIQSILSGI